VCVYIHRHARNTHTHTHTHLSLSFSLSLFLSLSLSLSLSRGVIKVMGSLWKIMRYNIPQDEHEDIKLARRTNIRQHTSGTEDADVC
jgi:hypothetical protein